MSRFDNVLYDEEAQTKSAVCKNQFTHLEAWIATAFPEGRAKSLVYTKLEEAFMWCGKAIRDAQIQREALKK